MKFKWRKWNRATHRDVGYFFFALAVIYSLSGIALNHINDWNPSYVVKTKEINLSKKITKQEINEQAAIEILKLIEEEKNYKKFYFPDDNTLKIFVKGGSALIDMNTGKGMLEKISRRKIFYEFNFLHYNNAGKYWKWVSDAFAVALMLLAITGLFVLKGKNGITRRGAWLTIAGILLPLIFLLIYL